MGPVETKPAEGSATRMIAVPVEIAPVVDEMVADFHRGATSGVLSYGKISRPLFDIPLLIGLGIFAGVFTFLMVVMVPRYQDIFKDFGSKLPEPTIFLLRLSDFFGRDFGWAILWALVIAIPIAVARLRPWPPRRPARGAAVSIVLAVVLSGMMVVVTCILVVLPMVTLIQSISSPARR